MHAFPFSFNFYFSLRFLSFACLFSKERGKDSVKFGWVGCVGRIWEEMRRGDHD